MGLQSWAGFDSRRNAMKHGLKAVVASALLAQVAASLLPAAGTGPDLVARGKYLVENVCLCTDCHTPRTETGQLIRSRWLQGAVTSVRPRDPTPAWAPQAPGLVGLSDARLTEAARLLETGIKQGGTPALAPMPRYRLTREDARAVVEYLRSLAPAKQQAPRRKGRPPDCTWRTADRTAAALRDWVMGIISFINISYRR
jgi:mono/diheme cytochrome c family protein